MSIDYRIIATVVFVIIAVMLLYPLRIPFPVSKFGRQFYKFIDDIPAGETVVFILGDSVISKPQLESATSLAMWMLWENGCNIITYQPDPECFQIAPDYIERAERYLGRKPEYGVEFVDLGYIPGWSDTEIASFFESIRRISNNQDKDGISLDDLPIMEGIDNGFDINYLIVNLDSMGAGPTYIRQVGLPYGVEIATIGTTGAIAASQIYLATGQLGAVSAGLLGSAEMEYLTGKLGLAFGQIVAVSMAGLYFTILVILGNVFYFLDKVQGGGDQQ